MWKMQHFPGKITSQMSSPESCLFVPEVILKVLSKYPSKQGFEPNLMRLFCVLLSKVIFSFLPCEAISEQQPQEIVGEGLPPPFNVLTTKWNQVGQLSVNSVNKSAFNQQSDQKKSKTWVVTDPGRSASGTSRPSLDSGSCPLFLHGSCPLFLHFLGKVAI